MLKLVRSSETEYIKCEKCQTPITFTRGVGAVCNGCQKYVPPVLGPSASVAQLRSNLKNLESLHHRLKGMIRELEALVKE